MRIKPIILTKIESTHTNYILDMDLEHNITFINGDSGTGRSIVFSFIQEIATEDKRIKCFNYLDINNGYKNSIKQSKGKVFVIDNADTLFDDNMRCYISMDTKNQYVIIGRNPTGLMLQKEEIYELNSETVDGITRFFLKQELEY